MPIDYDDMMQSGATGLEARYDEKDAMLYALGVGFMCVFVVGLNRCVWRRLYHLAETKYRLGS